MYFKTLSIVAFLLLSAQANEDKKELFNDKYLNSQKLDQYRDTNINTSSDFKISNIKEMTKISDETNTTTSTMIENSIKSNTLENEAQNLKEQIKSKDFQKKIVENENYILHDKKINWQQHLGQYKNRTNTALEQLKEKGTVSSELSSNQFLTNNDKFIGDSLQGYIPSDELMRYLISVKNYLNKNDKRMYYAF